MLHACCYQRDYDWRPHGGLSYTQGAGVFTKHGCNESAEAVLIARDVINDIRNELKPCTTALQALAQLQ
jgi:hypothetical protein